MEKSKYIFPTINLKETGINLRRIMDKRGITPKDVKKYLNLTSVQSVYNWCSAIFNGAYQFPCFGCQTIQYGNRRGIFGEFEPRIGKYLAIAKQVSDSKGGSYFPSI